MQIKIKVIASFVIIACLLLFSGCLKQDTTGYKIDLEVWGTSDSSDVYGTIFSKYKEANPFIGQIKYKKLDVDTYKQDLLNALASGQGPDIFFIKNTWLPSFKDKIEPASDLIFNEQEFRRDLVDVAASDFIDGGKIYASPLSVDSLALYYNKDLFNAEGITGPPATWDDVEKDVQKLTKIDQLGNVVQQGIAMGTAYNINRSTDLLGLLMLQKGTQMTNKENTEATFNDSVSIGGNSVQAGEDALKFYAQFADSSSPLYSWNPRLHYSIDSFFEGTAAMMINYSWHYDTIKSKNSKLNFAVANVPQFSGTQAVNFANYWGLAVAKNKGVNSPSDPSATQSSDPVLHNKVRVHEAWELLKFLTMKNNGTITLINGITGINKTFSISTDPAQEYLKSTGRPAARRDLIEQQKTDPILGPFAYGNLIAKSWYEQDPESIETILAEAIDSVNKGTASTHSALELASTRISQFMRKGY
jgi:ABC-type glycerol-3-phosphate transport system substrate-binding protein